MAMNQVVCKFISLAKPGRKISPAERGQLKTYTQFFTQQFDRGEKSKDRLHGKDLAKVIWGAAQLHDLELLRKSLPVVNKRVKHFLAEDLSSVAYSLASGYIEKGSVRKTVDREPKPGFITKSKIRK